MFEVMEAHSNDNEEAILGLLCKLPIADKIASKADLQERW